MVGGLCFWRWALSLCEGESCVHGLGLMSVYPLKVAVGSGFVVVVLWLVVVELLVVW